MSQAVGDAAQDHNHASPDELRATIRRLHATVARQEETIARQREAIAALQPRRPRPSRVEPEEPSELPSGSYTIIFDGGAIGNPGKGYGTYQIQAGDRVLYRLPVEFGQGVTNNQAEYRTLIEALEHLHRLLGDHARQSKVAILGDSQLVLNQIAGTWKVKNAELQPLHQRAVAILRGFAGYDVTWQPRLASVKLFGH